MVTCSESIALRHGWLFCGFLCKIVRWQQVSVAGEGKWFWGHQSLERSLTLISRPWASAQPHPRPGQGARQAGSQGVTRSVCRETAELGETERPCEGFALEDLSVCLIAHSCCGNASMLVLAVNMDKPLLCQLISGGQCHFCDVAASNMSPVA